MIHYKIWSDADDEVKEGECEILACTAQDCDGHDHSYILSDVKIETEGFDFFLLMQNVCCMLAVLTRDIMRKMHEMTPFVPEKIIEDMIQKEIDRVEKESGRL